MTNLERKLVSRLLSLICAVTIMGAEASGVTLPELRQIITDRQESAATGHLVYIEESFNREHPPFVNEVQEKIDKINERICIKVDAILDHKTKSAKMLCADLRDVDALLKEHNLPPEQKLNISRSQLLLIQDTYEIVFVDGSVLNEPQVLLSERPGPAYIFKMLSLGTIDKRLLSEDKNPILTEIDSNGKSLLRIQLTVVGQNTSKGTIECAPSLGYRFRRIQWSVNGRLTSETIADDYRDVNGVPYPFLYIDRRFDEDGKIRRETKYVIEDVQLGAELSANDFKIFVPAGAELTDPILSKTIHNIRQDGYMGIDDALDIGGSWLINKQ